MVSWSRTASSSPLHWSAISTAYVTLQTVLEITTRGNAAIVFQSLATADFQTILHDMEEVVRATAAEGATRIESTEDSYGFRWTVLRGNDFDGLVVGVNAVGEALQGGRLLDLDHLQGTRRISRRMPVSIHPVHRVWSSPASRGS